MKLICCYSCRRCGDDLYLDNDFAGWYVGCLQCGDEKNIILPQKIRPATDTEPQEKLNLKIEQRNRLICNLAAAGWDIRRLAKKFFMNGQYIREIIEAGQNLRQECGAREKKETESAFN